MWFLHSNKKWLSERFSLLSRYELLFEHTLFYFNVLYFYTIPNFYSHSHHYYYDYFSYYCFRHCHCHYLFFFFNAFNFYFSNFWSFYFIFVCIEYFQIFNKWRGRTLFKFGNKGTETESVSLMGSLKIVCLACFSDDLLSKWHSYISFDNYFFYSVSNFWFRFIMLLSHLYFSL